MTPLSLPIGPLQHALETLFAPWVRQLALVVRGATVGEVRLELPVSALHVHGGGVVCGQTLMAAADTAMVLAVMTTLDGQAFQPMTTVQLQTSFLRAIPADATRADLVARVLRKGRNLVFGEIEVLDEQGRLAAHATTTYTLL